MSQSDPPFPINTPPPILQENSTLESPKPVYEKRSLVNKTVLEAIIVFIILLSGLLVETYNRGILITGGSFHLPLFQLLLQRSIVVTLVFVLGYRVVKSSIALASSYLSMAATATRTAANHGVEILYDIFITLAIILLTMPVRPILQDSYLTTDSAIITQAYVRFDAIPSIAILLMPAIPLLLLILTYQEGITKLLKLGVIFSAFAIVGYFNNLPNYDARVYESRASWITRNWQKQGTDAQKALNDSQTADEKATAYFWMGVAQNRQKNYEKAIEYQLMAIELKPDYAAAHASLANGYLFTNQLEKSLEHGNRCVEYDPEYAWCYSALANYYGVTGKIDIAIQNAKKAVELDPHEQDLIDQLQSLIDFRNQTP